MTPQNISFASQEVPPPLTLQVTDATGAVVGDFKVTKLLETPTESYQVALTVINPSPITPGPWVIQLRHTLTGIFAVNLPEDEAREIITYLLNKNDVTIH